MRRSSRASANSTASIERTEGRKSSDQSAGSGLVSAQSSPRFSQSHQLQQQQQQQPQQLPKKTSLSTVTSEDAISELPLSDLRPQRSAPRPPGSTTLSPRAGQQPFVDSEPPIFSADRRTVTRQMSQSKHGHVQHETRR